ncbi:hypothetical protein [Psychroserpens damuponensis]|uniref:hypothetical protein n=1 Tax=Psychroserpens damuponensis TaxID=943936 RepID=UPI000590C6C7|nr:hypothetical protein [Psychroserpens damuponensis]
MTRSKLDEFKVIKYNQSQRLVWNTFVSNSKNATFLFHRDFMEYHQNRFEDFSLMIYKGDHLQAVLPASIHENILNSHQGLSYGGLVLSKKVKFETVIKVFYSVLKYLDHLDIHTCKIKLLPKIYHQLPSDEIDYLLFKTQAQLHRRDVSMVIDYTNKLEASSNRKRNLKRSKTNKVSVCELDGFEAFFNQILIPNLKQKYQTLPTHTLEEIKALKLKFPKNIRQFNAYHNNDIIAGVTIFESPQVAHAQYISTVSSKNELGGLDAIFDVLINETFSVKRYFSFGISNENQGQHINKGLLNWKESFGAKPITHDFFTINTKNYSLLKDVMI